MCRFSSSLFACLNVKIRTKLAEDGNAAQDDEVNASLEWIVVE